MTDIEKFNQTIADLESGKIRVAEKVKGEWTRTEDLYMTSTKFSYTKRTLRSSLRALRR